MRKLRVNRTHQREEISLLLRRMAFSQTALRLCEEEVHPPKRNSFSMS